MDYGWLVGSLHLLALGIGLGAVWTRRGELRGPLDAVGLARVLKADNWWGMAGGLWLVTGLLRAFAGLEKGPAYYLSNPIFHVKITLFVVVLALEVWPMLTLIRWRIARGKGLAPDTSAAGRIAAISTLQGILIVAMVFAATAMARGYGTRGD